LGAGDQILVSATYPNNTTPATPAGYTIVGTWSGPSSKLRLYRRTATGGERTVTIGFDQTLTAKAAAVAVGLGGGMTVGPTTTESPGYSKGGQACFIFFCRGTGGDISGSRGGPGFGRWGVGWTYNWTWTTQPIRDWFDEPLPDPLFGLIAALC